MNDSEIERSLGRIEGRMDAMGVDIAAVKLWQINHELGHHGLHGKGPGGVWNRQNIQTTGIVGVVVGIIEVVKSLMG